MDLTTIEEIRRLKYRYLRCIDLKRWDELSGILTVDATADYGTSVYGQPLTLEGREAIVGFMREKVGPDIITTHSCGQPEIDIDGDHATGIWRFDDRVIATEHRVMIAGSAFYEDRYRRDEEGTWRIRHTGYVRTYEAMLSLDDMPSFRLLSNRWDTTTS